MRGLSTHTKQLYRTGLSLAERLCAEIVRVTANVHVYTEHDEAKDIVSESDPCISELASASVRAHEEERERSALEVHDRIAAPLATVFLKLEALRHRPELDPPVQQEIQNASAILQHSIKESRNIMNDFYPSGLSEFGLVRLMEYEVEDFEQQTECLISLKTDCPVRPPRDVEITLYRIFHEALINVRRHAPEAKSTTVSITYRDQVAVLRVEDNGPGFDLEAENVQ